MQPHRQPGSRPAKCIPQKRVLFLKTHKTGSSTIANILFRYGDARNFTFLLPHATYFNWPHRFNAFTTFPTYGEPPNILCSHTRYNQAPMNWFFPKNRTRYITILREPVRHFESVFDFMEFPRILRLAQEPDPLATFLRNPRSFQLGLRALQKVELNLIRNPLLFDLGLPAKAFQNSSAVEKYIQFLEKEFDLVMVMEYFDESLILLKRLLCWTIDDVLSFKMNERRQNSTTNASRMSRSEDMKSNIRRWNAADGVLYEHFNDTFWKRVKAEGPSFRSDLESLRRRRSEMEQRCLSDRKRNVNTYGSKLVKGYYVKAGLPGELRRMCEKMTWSENRFLDYLRKKMIRKHVQIARTGVEKEAEKMPGDWEVATDLEYSPVYSTL